jgi:hypothetical protein
MWDEDGKECNPVEDLKKLKESIENSKYERNGNCFIPIPGTNLILLEWPETERGWNTLYKLTNTKEEDWIAAAKELWG